jgi:hypothetical protein
MRIDDFEKFWNSLSGGAQVAIIGVSALVIVGLIVFIARRLPSQPDPNAGFNRVPDDAAAYAAMRVRPAGACMCCARTDLPLVSGKARVNTVSWRFPPAGVQNGRFGDVEICTECNRHYKVADRE